MKSRKPRWYIVQTEAEAKAMEAKGFAVKFENGKWWVLAQMRDFFK